MHSNRRKKSPHPSLFKPRTQDPNFLLSVVMTTAKMLFFVVLIIGVSGSGLLLGVAKAWIETAPALDLTAFDSTAKTSFIYDKYGELITDFKGTENRVDVSLDEVPEMLQNAVIAIEDARFETHNGVDIKRIMGAFVTNLLNGSMQGGSTITQQLIKQTMLTSDQTYKRKLQEAYLALQLENVVSKDTILEEYLNVIYLGGSNYGVKVAAEDYFGKELNELTLRECAMLAGLIRNPYGYNPRLNYYSRNTPEKTDDRTDYVLKQMLQQEMITQEQYDQAINEQVHVLETSPSSSEEMYDNVYYVEYAIYDVVTKMLRVENLEDTASNRSAMENKLRTGGYSIYTSLDPKTQEAAQKVVSEWDNYPSTRRSADKVYKTSLGNGEYVEVKQPQAAAAITDWHTGELVAIVGGRSTPTRHKQLNRAYQMEMPVGSSIKPLSVYGPAFDLGYSPGSPVINAPIKIKGWDSKKGYPENYGGGGFTGVETLRKAINKSHNTATAQALFTYVGIENSVNYLLSLGVSEDHISATGAGLALGASGISPVEMAAAFGAIANSGEYLEPLAFSKVVDSNGNVYIDAQQVQIKRQAFKESTAWMLISVLKGCITDGTGSRAQFGNFTVAGKTGTNSDYRGVFFAGMTGYYAGAVWIGHDNYKPLSSGAQGGTYAAPLWAAIMKQVHKVNGITEDRNIMNKSASEVGLVKAKACAVSGMKPTSACKNDVNGYGITTDYYLSGTEPTKSCNMHRTVKLCTVSKKAPNSYCPSVRTYGAIYIPEGHPLRNDDISTVRKYFKGASTNKNSASVGKCTVHGKNKNNGDDSSNDESTIRTKAEKAISNASSLISNDKVSNANKKKLKTARTNLQNALDGSDLSKIKSLTSKLNSLVSSVNKKL